MSQNKKIKRQTVQPPTRPVKKLPAQPSSISKNFPFIILGVALLFTMYCRMRLLGVPMERDEGEYAYVGQQLLQGVPPFVSIYHVKLPGIYAAFAVIETIFGQTHKGIHLGLMFVNMLSAILVFLIGKRIFNPLSGALAAAVFCVLSLSQKFFGFSANAEQFVVFPALLGFLFLLRAFSPPENRPAEKWKQVFAMPILNFFLSGLLFGIAYTMKQHALFFIAFAGIYFLYKWFMQKPFNWKDLFLNGFVFSVGVGLPLGIICLIFLHLGLFDKFWWWTWYYPRQYVALISWADGKVYLGYTFTPIWNIAWLLFLLAGGGVIGLVVGRNWNKALFGIGFFVFAALAVSAGFSFYPHYFIYITPAIGFLCASGAEFISVLFKKSNISFLKNYAGAAVLLLFLCSAISNEKEYLFKMDGTMVDRTVYGGNPFPEALEIGKYIEQHTSPGDTIAVLGSEPEIPFYAHRRNATGYVYTYEMIADHPYAHGFQVEMSKEVEAAKPKYVVMINISASWIARRVDKPDYYIFDWAQKFIQTHYEQVGIVDIGNRLNALYCWEDMPSPAKKCIPPVKPGQAAFDPVWIAVYKRKD
ncbi:MAG: ArnT family glycosyltransferase [Bacteroidia bacterium]